jgi:hypothetical protein
MMTNEQRVARARALMDDELFIALMNEFEASAFDAAVYAKPADHEARQAACAEAKAIRDLRGKLAAIVREAKPDRKAAPA